MGSSHDTSWTWDLPLLENILERKIHAKNGGIEMARNDTRMFQIPITLPAHFIFSLVKFMIKHLSRTFDQICRRSSFESFIYSELMTSTAWHTVREQDF